MESFSVTQLPLGGLFLVQRKQLPDTRGFFSRMFCAEELTQAGFRRPIAQINHTLTRKRGALRGMHFQHPPQAEDKFVSCIRGEILDVAIDLRKDSPTFLNWHAEILSAKNARSMLIPEGFAHGFQTLTEDCELLYLHSRPYAAASEGGLNAVDPALAIAWPLPIAEISTRDAAHPFITPDFIGIQIKTT